MKVSEIKAVAPLADVYEMHPDAKYIVVVKPDTPPGAIMNIMDLGKHFGMKGAILAVEEVSFYEMGE